jgi:hypothetical protein
LDLLKVVPAKMSAPAGVEVVEDADHSLQVAQRHLKAVGETQDAAETQILVASSKFIGAAPTTRENLPVKESRRLYLLYVALHGQFR